TSIAFPAGVTALRLVSATDLPALVSVSAAVPPTFVTPSTSRSRFWPASAADAVTPENRSTAPPPSVKTGFAPVAVSVGASLTGRSEERRVGEEGEASAPLVRDRPVPAR